MHVHRPRTMHIAPHLRVLGDQSFSARKSPRPTPLLSEFPSDTCMHSVNQAIGHPFRSVPRTALNTGVSIPYCFGPNYHKLSGFEQHKLIFVQFWKTLVRNQFPVSLG